VSFEARLFRPWRCEIGALAGLMVLSRGLEASELIDRAGRRVIARPDTVRGLAEKFRCG
jgi:hypothetical protein